MFNVFAVFRGLDLMPFIASGDSALASHFRNPHGVTPLNVEKARRTIFDSVIADGTWVQPDAIVIEGGIVAIGLPVRAACHGQPSEHLHLQTRLVVDPVFKPEVAGKMIEARCLQVKLPLTPGVSRKLGIYWDGFAVGTLTWLDGKPGKCGYVFSATASPSHEFRNLPNKHERNDTDGMQLVRDVVDLTYDVTRGRIPPYDTWFVTT